MILFALVVYLAIATFCACVVRIITSSWRHTGVALLWPLLALCGLLVVVGSPLVYLGNAGIRCVARLGNRLTAGWLP